MKPKKFKKAKEPSFIHKLVDIYFEQAKCKKALRILEKQQWGFEFLSMLLVSAAEKYDKGLRLEIVNKSGQHIVLTYDAAKKADVSNYDSSILDNLDNELAVTTFIREHSTR